MEIPEFEIVPRVGLAIVGVAAALPIVAIAVNKPWPLQFLQSPEAPRGRSSTCSWAS